MRIVRYAGEGIETFEYGTVVDGQVHAVVGTPGTGFEVGQEIGALESLRLTAPCAPSKVVCVGRNYAAHITEMGRPWPTQPFIFLKAPNAVVGHGDAVVRPRDVERFDYEGEMAVVIGRRAARVDASSWREFVLGFTCANDLTVRDWQEGDGQWARAKSADTLCPLGPWVETEIADPQALRLRTRVNRELRQDSTTADFVFGIGELLAFITAAITLEPGDAVLTGTPGGVGPVVAGDLVEVEVEGIGTLRNEIVDAT